MEAVKPVVIQKATRFEFCSEANHRRYSICVAPPLTGKPERGCPILYVLDGDWYFSSAVEAVRQNAPGVAVVGIGYPDDEAHVEAVLQKHQPLPECFKGEAPLMAAVSLERLYDLTLPASDEVLAKDCAPGQQIPARHVGGLDSFLEVLGAEIKPRVAATVPIDSSNQAIFGHSIGGLAVVHALFVQPHAFRTFIAASPSIWWNEKAVLRGEAKFAEAVRAGTATPRVLVTMGAEEETPDPKVAVQFGMDVEWYAGKIRRARMVENARELTERLRGLRGSGGYQVAEYALFAKQDHGISAWPALGRAVSFAFPP